MLNNKANNNKGFSLIELSIVLIIMGLLVAGVTGGSALIKSAQLRTVITETNNYKTSYNAYYTSKDTIPAADNFITDSKASWDLMKDAGVIDKTANANGGIDSKYKGASWYLYSQDSTVTTKTFGDNVNQLVLGGAATAAQKNTVDLKTNLAASLYGEDAKLIDSKLDDGDIGIAEDGAISGLVLGIDGNGKTCSYESTKADGLVCNLAMKLDF